MEEEQLFRLEVDEVVGLLREQVSTHIADVGGGRGVAFSQVVARLERMGNRVYTVACIESLTEAPLAALKLSTLWNAASLAESASLTKVILRCCDVVLSRKDTVIAISNLDQIDSQTWAVLEALRVRTRVTLLSMGSLASRSRQEGGLTLSSISWPSAEVVLGSLPYVAVASLLEERLGEPVDRDLVRRIYLETQGQYKLVLYLLESAKRTGRIQLRERRWVMVDGLWNPVLQEYLQAYLSAKPRYVQEALESIAALGIWARDVDDAATDFPVSERTIRMLEEEGLLSKYRQESFEVYQVAPPIIARCLSEQVTRRKHSLTHDLTVMNANDLITVEVGAVSGKNLQWPQSHPVFQRSRFDTIALAGVIQTHWLSRLEQSRHAWETNPSPVTALRFLQALSLRNDSSQTVEAVLEEAEVMPCDADVGVQLALFKLRWQFFHDTNAEQIFKFTRSAVGHFPQFRNLVVGDFLFLCRRFWAAKNRVELLRKLGLEENQFTLPLENLDYLSWLDVVHAAPYGGDALEAIEPFNLIEDDGDVQQSRGYSVSQIAAGHHLDTTRRILDLLEQAIEDLDVQRIIWHSYSAAVGLYFLGKPKELRWLLEMVFTLDVPGSMCRYYYKALLHINAILEYQSGNATTAQRLIDHAESLDVGDADLAGVAAEIPQALAFLIDQNPFDAEKILLSGIERCIENEWKLSAFFLGFVYVQLSSHPDRREQLEKVGLYDLVAERMAAQLDLHIAVPSSDIKKIVEITDRLIAEGDSYFASIGYACAGWRALEALEPEISSEYFALRDALDVQGDWDQFSSLHKAQQGVKPLLTNREIEIAILAGDRSSAEIARYLALSQRTVENHLHRAMRKLNISNRQTLASMAQSMPFRNESSRENRAN